jgi:hypothetical protein
MATPPDDRHGQCCQQPKVCQKICLILFDLTASTKQIAIAAIIVNKSNKRGCSCQNF